MHSVPDQRLPAYAKLRDTLAARVAANEWQPDDALPSESQLAREYSLSVGTVRRAVEELVAEGLLERRRGSGTYLRKPAFDATLFRFFMVRSDDGDPQSIPTSRLVARTPVRAPGSVAQILGAEEAIRIERVRSLADTPILAEEIYIPSSIFPGFHEIPRDAFGPLLYPLYLERFGIFIANAVDEVFFGAADAKRARQLKVAAKDPVAIIERTAFDLRGRPVEWRRAYGSAQRFRYRMTIR